MTKYVRKPPQMWYKLVINLESRFITDILPSDAARPRGQYISYKPPSRFITLTYRRKPSRLSSITFGRVKYTLSIITSQLHCFQLRTTLNGKDFKGFFSWAMHGEAEHPHDLEPRFRVNAYLLIKIQNVFRACVEEGCSASLCMGPWEKNLEILSI